MRDLGGLSQLSIKLKGCLDIIRLQDWEGMTDFGHCLPLLSHALDGSNGNASAGNARDTPQYLFMLLDLTDGVAFALAKFASAIRH